MMERAPNKAAEASARKILFELQVEQHQHDEVYHREIARLSLHQRLNHMALHFAKYAGKVAAAPTIEATMPVFVDTLVIALSTTNILNLELWDLLDHGDQEYPGLIAFGRHLAQAASTEVENRNELLHAMTIAAGAIAGACEKIDHLEEISFRAEMRKHLGSLAALSLAIISSQGNDPAVAVRQRLADVKSRLKLHGRI